MNRCDANASVSEIVTLYSDKLFAYIRQRVSRAEDAEDILQDVFYQLTRTVADSDTEIKTVSGWLFRVAHNSIINLWRKRREIIGRLPADDEEEELEALSDILFSDPSEGPDKIFLRKLVWQELEYALADLPPEQSEVFCLTVFEGVPVKAIAENLNVPVSTVLSRKHYAVKQLRTRLRGLYEDLVYN